MRKVNLESTREKMTYWNHAYSGVNIKNGDIKKSAVSSKRFTKSI